MRLPGVILVLLLSTASAFAQNYQPRYVRPELIPLPEPMQFIDRILRPCGGTSTGIVIVTTTDINLNPCPGGSVKINGTPITPGAGLPDPGSSGYVVRTALNTTVARTFQNGTAITVTNGTGVAGNTSFALNNTAVTPGSYTNANLTVDAQGRLTAAASGSAGGVTSVTGTAPVVSSGGATPAISCPTCVTSAAALTSTAIMAGAGLQTAQTPSATTTLSAGGNISTPGSVTTGNAGVANGNIALSGSSSGTVNLTVASAAGSWSLQLPINDGAANDCLKTDGAGITSWAGCTASGTVTGTGTTNALPKWTNGAGGVLGDSRITDNGTDIALNNIVGTTYLGDYLSVANATYGSLDTVGEQVFFVANAADGGNQQVLDLVGDPLNLPHARLVSFGPSINAVLSLSGANQTAALLAGSVGVTLDNTASSITIDATSGLLPGSNGTVNLGSTSAGFKQAFFDATITASGTTGAQTINKSAGSVNFAAAATSLVVTSNKVTANSIILCTVATNDATLKFVSCVPAAGSFTMFGTAATAETRVNFWILNQ